jgi:hypothetical protein
MPDGIDTVSFQRLQPSIKPETVVTLNAAEKEWEIIFFTSLRQELPISQFADWLKAHGCLVTEDNLPKIVIIPNPNYQQEELLHNLQQSLTFWLSVENSAIAVNKLETFYC